MQSAVMLRLACLVAWAAAILPASAFLGPVAVPLTRRSAVMTWANHHVDRRRTLADLGRGLAGGASLLGARPALAAQPDDKLALVASAAELGKLIDNIEAFKLSLMLPDPPTTLAAPRAVSFTTFQKLESKAKPVAGKADYDPEDFLEMAADYASHAGAARDLVKLAKLGRQGEQGSEELVKVYADRAINELKQANEIIQVLALSVQ